MKFFLVMMLCLCASALPQQRKRRAVDSESLKKDIKRVQEDTNQRTVLNDVTDRCSSIRRRCVESGQLFKRNVVCASNMKRYMNLCHLQIRSCDLLEQSGDELQQKRCLWIEVPDDADSGDDSSGTNSKETNSKSNDEDSDVTGSDSKIDGKSEVSSSDEEDAFTPTDADSGDDSSGTNSKETNSKSKDEDSDVTGSDSKIDGKSEGRSSSEIASTSNYEDASFSFSSSDEEDAFTPTGNDRDTDGNRGDNPQ